MSDGDSAFLLQAYTQSYDWGKLGNTSKVAQYAQVTTPGFHLDDNKPYAELWMGTHPNLPSKLLDGTPLPAILKDNPQLLGSQDHRDLPFLFKVLAIRKALSIQSHPNKAQAEKLHAAQPQVYKDDNHKPELAIAITPFQALCGFIPMASIIENIDNTPELAALLPHQLVTKFKSVQTQHPSNSANPVDVTAKKAALKELFAALMTASPDAVKTQLSKLVTRYEQMSSSEKESSPEAYFIPLVLELNRQFPGDIGVFCVYVLNVVTLQPGESIFLGAGEPHAYISGDIVECMATSDNVLRAGLTPKPRDVPNLIESLTYNMGLASRHMVQPTPWGSGDRGATKTVLYDPPIPEFSVLNVKIEEGETELHRGINGPSVAIVTQGRGEMVGGSERGSIILEEGNVVFIGADVEIVWKSRHGLFEVYRAFCE